MLECSEYHEIKYENKHLQFVTEGSGQSFDCVVTFVKVDQELNFFKMSFLDKEDLDYIHIRKLPEQMQDVALGRFAIKEAVSELTKSNLGDVHIRKGIFNQPLVSISGIKSMAETHVSVSHCGKRAVSVAYPAELIIGIDLEDKIAAVEKVIKLSEFEREILESNELDATIIWTIREALIKCLKTNVFFSAELMVIENMRFENGYLRGTFKYFRQYSFLARREERVYISLVFPTRTYIKSEKL